MRSMAEGYKELVEARKQWEAENPELAALWNDAMREDHERETRREAEIARGEFDMRIPDRLIALEVPHDAVKALRFPENTGAWIAVGDFLDDKERRFCALLGTVGTGKTVAGLRALVWGLRRGYRVAFTRATTFARLSGYDRKDREWFEDLCRARVVLMDDLGTEHLNEYGRSLFNEWFDYRASIPGAKTVLTANLSKDVFAKRYGDRITDRIAGSGVAHVSTERSLRRRKDP